MNFSFEPSRERDSIGSQQAEELNHSVRSSFFGTSKSFTRCNDKKVLVDKRVLAKLINFLKNVVKELNIDDKEIQMIEKFIQTDEDEIQYNKNHPKILNESNLEEALELRDTVEKLKLENENFQKKIDTLQLLNTDLNDKISHLNGLLQINLIEREELNKGIEKLKEEINNLNKNSSFREEIKTDSTNKLQKTDETKHTEENQKKNKVNSTPELNLGIFQDESTLKEIVSFLQPKEFYNLYYSSRSLHSVFKKEDLHINILKYTIELKNLEIKNLKSIDWIREYEISESEVERLVREYIQNNKVPGSELKGMLVKALSYIDREIKKPLGVVPESEKNERKSSLLGR
jgi:chromosome segregation ATPase